MDNENNQTQEQEEVTGIKISEFPVASALSESDTVTGLQAGSNVRFTFSAILSWIALKLSNAFVSASRTINGKSLSSDVTLTATDVGARPNNWTPSAADVGAIPTTAKGAPLGVAELDSNGQVPSSQLDLSGKQDEITASGILKGDGAGGVSAAVAGTDYQAPLTAGTDYATPGMIPTVPSISTTAPAMDGTGAAGSTGEVSDAGHTHPTDTSRVPVYGMGENLLDNADFRNPINQRGASSYTATGNSNYYSIDRWYLYGASRSLTIGTGYVTITPPSGATASLTQRPQLRYSDVAGTQMTISALLSSGELLAATNTIPANAPSSNTSLISAYSTVSGFVRLGYNNGFYFLFQTGTGTSLSVVKAKLEPGTEQTVCHNEGTDENPVWVPNEIPDYEEELIKCQTSTADSSDTYANKSLATEQQLAYVETGTTASRNYAVGEYFCWNGSLLQATSAIPAGTPFNSGSGGNCKSAYATAYSSGAWTPTNASAVSNAPDRNGFIRYGNILVVYVAITLNSDLANLSQVDICTDVASEMGVSSVLTVFANAPAFSTFTAATQSDILLRLQYNNNKLTLINRSGSAVSKTNRVVYANIVLSVL